VHCADQPFIALFDQVKVPLTSLDARRPAADSWHVASRPTADHFRTIVFADLDIAAVEGELLLLESIERAAQRPLVDGRPYFASGARTQRIEGLTIARECVLNRRCVPIDDRSRSSGRSGSWSGRSRHCCARRRW